MDITAVDDFLGLRDQKSSYKAVTDLTAVWPLES
jgi:hypothetical protein